MLDLNLVLNYSYAEFNTQIVCSKNKLLRCRIIFINCLTQGLEFLNSAFTKAGDDKLFPKCCVWSAENKAAYNNGIVATLFYL